MATWREFVGYISANYKFETPQPNCIQLLFDVGGGRSQVVLAFGVGLDDPEMAHIDFFSPFADVSQISPQQLASVMEESNLLGIARIGDFYGYQTSAPLANLDANEITWPLMFVTFAADNRERELGLGDNF